MCLFIQLFIATYIINRFVRWGELSENYLTCTLFRLIYPLCFLIYMLLYQVELFKQTPLFISDVQTLAESHGAIILETSAKTGTNVEELFLEIGEFHDPIASVS